jgi:Glycosyltransferase family 87
MKRRDRLVIVFVLLVAVGLNVLYVHQVVNGGSMRQFFHDSDVNVHNGCDFFGLYNAGHKLLRGQNIYAGDPGKNVVPCCFAFRYLPVGAAAAAPLTKATPREAYLLWLALLELVALLAAWATYRHVRGLAGAVLAALWLAGSPLYLELYMGQFNLLQAAFWLGALLTIGGGKTRVGEAYLGAAMLWKLTGWLGAPVLAVKQRWRTLLVVGAIAIGTTAVYVALTGRSLTPFFDNFRPASQTAAIYRGDLGVLMFLRVWLGAKLPAAIVYGVPAGALALCAALTLAARRASAADLLALWATAYFFIFPTIWEHHYLMLLPALVAVYASGRARVLWVAALLIALPTPYFFAGPHGAHWHGLWPLVYHAVKPAAALLVLGAAAWNVWRAR